MSAQGEYLTQGIKTLGEERDKLLAENDRLKHKLAALIEACKDAVWVHGGVRDWNPRECIVIAFDKALADAQRE